MKAAIISVGTELLFGQITNTNSVYLSQQLNTLGFDVMYHFTVGDNPARLRKMIETAYEDCSLVVTTGGLGPTQDDLTKETVTAALGDETILDSEALNRIKKAFAKMNREMSANNEKQAYLPSRAEIFYNDAGTAPGFALEDGGRTAICLPGPPREMKMMFERQAKPYLESRSDGKIRYRMIRTFGIGESSLETAVLDLIDGQTDPTLATYAKDGECALRVASKRATAEEASQAVDDMVELVKERVGGYVYSCDNEDLCEAVARKLIEENISISCAESCTGGLFAEMLTKTPGVSAVFDRGIVTYSNRSKTDELGVKESTLEKYGAVSVETAAEMARGLKAKTGSRLCVSITGIAGPGGGSAEKPAGTFCTCVIFDEKEELREVRHRNVDRNVNRNYFMLYMMNMVYRVIS
ncbi:MAG: competence/damage-inducible protein A [Clostridiales bacterium]|nr:competence/damage-inducible protein A [Clostridiales bacterium]